MTPFLKRNLLIPVSVLLFLGLIIGLIKLVPELGSRVEHLEFIVISIMVSLSVVIMLFWICLGVFAGLSSFLVAMIFLYGPLTALNPYYYSVLILAFFISSFLGHFYGRKINKANQGYTIRMEKLREDVNLIQEHCSRRKAEVKAMGEKINALLKLKGVADSLSLALSEDDIVKTVSRKTYDIFGTEVRVGIYMTDRKSKELDLSFAVKGERRSPMIMKKGGVFDRWAVKNMKSLLVKDASKDFRFAVGEEERKDDFVSLMIKPLILENNFLGIIRVDSPEAETFGQYELRLLDFIGDLTAVALDNAHLYQRTMELAIRDSLTGLFVYRYFMERLEEEVKRALRNDDTFALLMLDIDSFKDFNDEHGHVWGDAVLKNISRILEKRASAGDMVARYGGEEFVLLSLKSDREKASAMAEEIRKEIANSPIVMRRKKYRVTVSVGVAVFPGDARLREDIVAEADRRLYRAKAEGKNKVCSK
ncbi:MAG: diguanylate cyclase [Candidatus Omnitrophica bacterium]|nr:diguanylate cyclase [Candidatus Omnitrophota bacterium]